MVITAARQQELLPINNQEPADLSTNFHEIYGRQQWTAFDDLEKRYHLIDKTHAYRSLVNTSISKDHPYHSWFRYREGYAGDLVKDLISQSGIDPRLDYIADPMCGSGSTLVASKEVGVDCLGLDVNPYAVEISNAKVFPYRGDSIQEALKFVIDLREKKSLIADIDESWNVCGAYFNNESLASLAEIYAYISKIRNDETKRILRVIWLSILEECSNRKKDGNGLVGRPTNVKDIFEFFREKGKAIISDFLNHPLPQEPRCTAVDQSALQFSSAARTFATKTGKQLGAVIFSPPYANSFDYFESYKIELLLGGYFDLKGYRAKRKSLIRNYRITDGPVATSDNPYVEVLCDEVQRAIPEKEQMTGVRDGRTRLVPYMLRGYFEDMKIGLTELYSAVRDRGRVYIVVDQSSYVGIIIPTDILIAELAEKVGFRVTQVIKCRKANSSGQQLKRFPYLKKVLRESIVCLEANH